MNVLWEAMIAEMRALRLELDNRRHFTEDNQPIQDSRAFVDNWTTPKPAEDPEVAAAKTAMSMRRASDEDLFEVG